MRARDPNPISVSHDHRAPRPRRALLALTLALALASPLASAAWGTAGMVSALPPGGAQDDVELAGNAAGQAVAVWAQWNSGTGDYDVFASVHQPGGGWSAPVLIEADPAHAVYPHVAIDAAGNAIAVWAQNGLIHANRYAAGSGWSGAAPIHASVLPGEHPRVTMDGAGNAFVVWHEYNAPTVRDIRANRYDVGTDAWGVAQTIEAGAGDARMPSVAADPAGNAVAAWMQMNAGVYSVYANRYLAGSGWGSPVLIESDDAGDAQPPDVGMDAAGNAIVVWVQNDGGSSSNVNAYANHYQLAGDTWGARISLEIVPDQSRYPRVAVNPAGQAVATWVQLGSPQNILANVYQPGTGWGGAVLVENDNFNNAFDPRVAINADGDAVVVWEQLSGGPDYYVWANRYLAGSGWAGPERVDPDNTPVQDSVPSVSLGADGNALVVWHRSVGVWPNSDYTIWSNAFSDTGAGGGGGGGGGAPGPGAGTPQPVPTLGAWGLMGLSLALGMLGARRARRRRAG